MQIQNIDENLSMNISDTSGVSLQVSDVDTSLAMNVDTNDVINLNIINEEGNITMEVETGDSKVEGTTDHSKLKNLDYAHSGHTGFQPKGDYVEDKNYVHTDNNFTDTEKTKLESLSNYDDTLIKKEVSSNTSQINTLKTSVENKAEKTEIPDVSKFITNSTDDLVNYYNKKEIDTKLENLPSGGTELTGGDNTVIEDNKINVYTNTGYKVIDKDIQLQSIIDSETTGENKMVYVGDSEVVILYDGTDKIRRSENGIDFEIITLPCVCKAMAYNKDKSRLYGTDATNYFIYSDDDGVTWNAMSNSRANGVHQIAIGYGTGFRASYKATKEIINWSYNESSNNMLLNSRITSTIVPEFTSMINNTQFVWCNSTGTFKYGAGSQEGNFASLNSITVNLLKRVNNITMVGLKNDNRMYLLEPATSITQYKWVEHELPTTCTLNDIVFNPYDKTYYLFTDNVTYYKTKDFVEFIPVDKNSLRGIQGHFTLEGIQMTTSNHNELLLAPTRTTLENKAQEWDRGLNKDLWVGNGLELTEEGKVNVKDSESIGVNSSGIYLKKVDFYHLPEIVFKSAFVSTAQLWTDFDPNEMENWFWEFGYPNGTYPYDSYMVHKIVFNQAGSFYDQMNWETEYTVEQYEYGYIYIDAGDNLFEYVKLGNLSWFFNKGE